MTDLEGRNFRSAGWIAERHRSVIFGLEMSLAPTVPNQHHRAGDLVDPLWGLLDMTPEGRGDFFPKINYD